MPFIPEHKTNILPLRWFANSTEYLSLYPLKKALRHENKVENTNTPLSKAGHRWWKIYSLVRKPYEKWGTTYLRDWHISED